MFRAKFLGGLRELLDSNQLERSGREQDLPFIASQLTGHLSKKSWKVYSMAPLAGPQKLLDYLSRYTNRVAISNDRLLACRDGQVTFRYRDRQDGDRSKTMELGVDKFIGRFLCHVLSSGFMRIRHYGILSNGHRRSKLAVTGDQLSVPQPSAADCEDALAQWIREVLGVDLDDLRWPRFWGQATSGCRIFLG